MPSGQMPQPAPADIERQRQAIEAVLTRLVEAYERLDAAAIKRVWPSAPDTLTRDLANARSYRLELLDTRITINGDAARVTCTRRIAFQPVTGRTPPSRTDTIAVLFTRAPSGWLISDVQIE
jgi:hypothetical protein